VKVFSEVYCRKPKKKYFENIKTIYDDINYCAEKVEEVYKLLETKVTVLKRIYYKEGSSAREIKNT
jgi:hypothetical protein